MSLIACGKLGDEAVHRIGLRGGDLEVSILTWGATIQDIAVHGPDGPHHPVLGFDSCEEYLRHRLYMGCVVGRVANRIANGRFQLGGRNYQLECNNYPHHLHGGPDGFSRKIWTIEAADDKSVDLMLLSPDGDQGYPGALTVRCRYSIEHGRTLRIALTATTDAPTIVNLATHSYFNLNGEAGDILNHHLRIQAESYLPVDSSLIPTGEILPVAGTPYDFTRMRPVNPTGQPVVYDHTYVLPESGGALREAARLESPISNLSMEVWTTEPGVQFFDGGSMRHLRGRGGLAYGPHAGLCLEPQRFPDSPNHGAFTDIRLAPSQIYDQAVEYRFQTAG